MKRLALLLLALAVLAPLAIAVARAEDEAPTPPDVLGDREFLRSNYTAAESYYRKALEVRPDDMHALSRLAMLLTWRGQYDEAIALYERGLKQEPDSMELKRGLAQALTWGERYGRALQMYGDLLKERPGDEGITYEMAQAQAWSGDNAAAEKTLHDMVARNPRHLKARVLLAQVHGWSGQPGEAEKIYRSVLSEDPGNVTALVGLGDVLAAQGKADEALAAYDKALGLDSGNRKAMEGRARVFQSEGRTPEALDAVRQTLELYPDARDARRLGREIGGPLRPSLQLWASTTQDTDDNDLAQWGGTYTHYLEGRGHVGVTFTHAQTDAQTDIDPSIDPGPSSATPVAKYDTLRLLGAWRTSRRFIMYAEAGPERTTVPFPEDPAAALGARFLLDPTVPLTHETHNHVAGSATFEVDAADWFTLVASGSTERLVGTTQAFMNDVGIQAATLTTIFTPHASVRIRFTGQVARFTDDNSFDVDPLFTVQPDAHRDNRRGLASGSVSWRLPLKRPRVSVHYSARWMSYARDLRQGYFAPDDYLSHIVGFDISDTIGKHVYWGGGLDKGVQRIERFGSNGSTHNDVLSYRLLAGLNFSDRASVEVWHSRSDMALQSASGFKSSEGGIRMVFKFGSALGPASPGRRAPEDRSGSHD